MTHRGCNYLNQETVDWFDQMSDLLDDKMSLAASQAGAIFVDPRTAFGGKEACSPTDERINAIVAYSSSGSGRVEPGAGSFHPKASGQDTYAQLVGAAVPAPPKTK